MSKKQKYLLLGSFEEVQNDIDEMEKEGKKPKIMSPRCDIKFADGYVWISLIEYAIHLGTGPGYLCRDHILDSMKRFEKKTGIFPVREFEINEP